MTMGSWTAAGARNRNLVLVRAGDRSVHESWLAPAQDRSFDLAVSYCGARPGTWQARADHYGTGHGPKWQSVADWLDANWQWASGYDYVAVPDDDLAASSSVWATVFRTMHEGGLDLAQPALAQSSDRCHPITISRPGSRYRLTNFVVDGLAVFSARALRWCAPTFRLGGSSLGPGYAWSNIVRRAGGRVGIVDCARIDDVTVPQGVDVTAHASPTALEPVPAPELYDELMLMAAFGVNNPYDPFVELTVSDDAAVFPPAAGSSVPVEPASFIVVGSNTTEEIRATVSSMVAAARPGDEVIVVDATFGSHLRQSLSTAIGDREVKMLVIPDEGLAESYDRVLPLAANSMVVIAASGWELGPDIRLQMAAATGCHLVTGTAPVGLFHRSEIAALGGMRGLSRKVTSGPGQVGTGDLLAAAASAVSAAGGAVTRAELDCRPSVVSDRGSDHAAGPGSTGAGSPPGPTGPLTQTFSAELLQSVHLGALDAALALTDLLPEDQAQQYDLLTKAKWPLQHPFSVRRPSTWSPEVARAVADGPYRTGRLVHALSRRNALAEAATLLEARGLSASALDEEWAEAQQVLRAAGRGPVAIGWRRSRTSAPLAATGTRPATRPLGAWPRVSVVTLTYNQQDLVGQAIESVAAQDYPGEIEMLVADDFSTDSTPEVVSAYARKYPRLVRPLLRGSNLGSSRNFFETWKQCSGDYVAVLDGDDYWTSPSKLREQVTVLESDHGLSFCFHRATILYLQGGTMTIPPERLPPVLSLGSLVPGNIVPSCTVIYRRGALPEYPEWLRDSRIVDYALHFLHALAGPFAFLDRNWAAYRIHSGNMFASLPDAEQLTDLLEVRAHLRPGVPEHLLSAFDSAQAAISARAAALLPARASTQTPILERA
jgi:hypothetical protein